MKYIFFYLRKFTESYQQFYRINACIIIVISVIKVQFSIQCYRFRCSSSIYKVSYVYIYLEQVELNASNCILARTYVLERKYGRYSITQLFIYGLVVIMRIVIILLDQFFMYSFVYDKDKEEDQLPQQYFFNLNQSFRRLRCLNIKLKKNCSIIRYQIILDSFEIFFQCKLFSFSMHLQTTKKLDDGSNHL